MAYKKATFEEYQKASQFAQIRYRVGVYVQLVAVILLLFLVYYTVTNIEEMKASPIDYAEENLGVTCTYPMQYTFGLEEINITYGSRGNTTNITEW